MKMGMCFIVLLAGFTQVPSVADGASRGKAGATGGARSKSSSSSSSGSNSSPSSSSSSSSSLSARKRGGEKPFGDEARLLSKLLRGYERAVRPVDNASHTINVKVNFALTQILDMDEKNQVLTTNVWFSQEWKDEKLRWNAEEYNGLKKMRIPPDLIWRPDIVLYNGVDDYGDKVYAQCLAMVGTDGTVFWAPIANLRSTCKLDLTFFPFDDQTCHFKVGSWTYDGFQVDLSNKSAEMDLDQYTVNGGWDLISTKTRRNVVYYPCCPEPFPDVTFSIYLRRRTLYYILNVVVPCLLLSGLSMLGFWLPQETGEKVSLGLTVLLAFYVLSLSLSARIPETSEYVPLLGFWLPQETGEKVSLGLTVLLAFYVLSLSLSAQIPETSEYVPLLGFWIPRDTGEKVSLGLTVLLAFQLLGLSLSERIPETSEYVPLIGFWLPGETGEKVSLGLTVLLAFYLLNLSLSEHIPETSDYVPLIGVYLMVIMILTSISVAMCVFVLHLHRLGQRAVKVPPWLHKLVTRYLARLVGMSYIIDHRRSVIEEANGGSTSANHVYHDREEIRPLRIECEELNARYKLIQVEGSGLYILARDGEGTPLEKDDKEEINDLHKVKDKGKVLRAMKAIMVQNDDEECQRVTKNELLWHDIAEIIDRFFFWLCFITITLSTVCILVVLPLSKPDPLR